MSRHGTFIPSEADYAAHTEKIPRKLDRQFLDLVARIGGETVTYHWEEPAGALPLRV